MSRGVERRALDGFGVESSLSSSMTRYTLHSTECIRLLEAIVRASATLRLSCTVYVYIILKCMYVDHYSINNCSFSAESSACMGVTLGQTVSSIRYKCI